MSSNLALYSEEDVMGQQRSTGDRQGYYRESSHESIFDRLQYQEEEEQLEYPVTYSVVNLQVEFEHAGGDGEVFTDTFPQLVMYTEERIESLNNEAIKEAIDFCYDLWEADGSYSDVVEAIASDLSYRIMVYGIITHSQSAVKRWSQEVAMLLYNIYM